MNSKIAKQNHHVKCIAEALRLLKEHLNYKISEVSNSSKNLNILRLYI